MSKLLTKLMKARVSGAGTGGRFGGKRYNTITVVINEQEVTIPVSAKLSDAAYNAGKVTILIAVEP